MRAIQAYQGVQARTATPRLLLAQLLRGLDRFLEEGARAFAEGREDDAIDRVNRAANIVTELWGTLDTRHAPALGERLHDVYAFASGRLTSALLDRDPRMLEEAHRALRPVIDGFLEVLDPASAEAA